MWDLGLHFARVTDMIAEANYSFTWSFFSDKKLSHISSVGVGGSLWNKLLSKHNNSGLLKIDIFN